MTAWWAVPPNNKSFRRWAAILLCIELAVVKKWLKQAWHQHNERFTPRHAIWRADELRSRDNVRMYMYMECVGTYHDEIVGPLSWTVRKLWARCNHWETGVPMRAAAWTFWNCRHDLARTTRIPTYPHAHCHEFFPYWSYCYWHVKLRAMR